MHQSLDVEEVVPDVATEDKLLLFSVNFSLLSDQVGPFASPCELSGVGYSDLSEESAHVLVQGESIHSHKFMLVSEL